MNRPRLRAYLGLGLLAAGLCGLALSGDLIVHIERFVAFYGVSLAGFALLAAAATSLPLRGALVAAVVLRVIFLPGTPSPTDGLYRYQWDGRVQQTGINPYRYAPVDPRLDRVGYVDRALVNHPQVRTVYPPLAEATFFGSRRPAGALSLSSSCSAPSTCSRRRLCGGWPTRSAGDRLQCCTCCAPPSSCRRGERRIWR